MNAILVTSRRFDRQQIFLSDYVSVWSLQTAFGESIEYRQLTQQEFDEIAVSENTIFTVNIKETQTPLHSTNPPKTYLTASGKTKYFNEPPLLTPIDNSEPINVPNKADGFIEPTTSPSAPTDEPEPTAEDIF
jgi:hypothetical protein